MCVTCRATIFLWRRVRMMATSRFRSLRGLRFFLPRAVSTSVFFTICSHAAHFSAPGPRKPSGRSLVLLTHKAALPPISGACYVFHVRTTHLSIIHRAHMSDCIHLFAVNILSHALSAQLTRPVFARSSWLLKKERTFTA